MTEMGKWRFVAVVGGGAVAVTLLAIAFVFASSRSTAELASDAQTLHWVNSVSGASAVARAGTAQAVAFGLDLADSAGGDAVDTAVAEARATIEAARVHLDAAGSVDGAADHPLLVAHLESFLAAAEGTVDAVASGDAQQGAARFEDRLEPAYGSLHGEVAAALDALEADIVATEGRADTIGIVTQVLATLLIPAAAILLYFLFARRQYREAKLQMEAKVQAAQELAMAKDEFIAGVSHELRTPLTGIYGFSEYLLEAGILDPDEALELIGHINQEAAELSRMVEDLLSAARLDAGALTFDVTAVDVRREIDAIVTPMRRAGAAITVDGAAVPVEADAVRLRQILRNLVSNAVKHGGDSIRVSIDGDAADQVAVTVADDGDGVRTEVAERLFDRFVHDGSESLLVGSVGLGLSIARALARRMGGDVGYVRTAGWTRFVLTLPKGEATAWDDEEPESAPIAEAVPFETEPAATVVTAATLDLTERPDLMVRFER